VNQETQADLIARFRGTTMRATSTQYELLRESIDTCAICGYWINLDDLDEEGSCEDCRGED
jgi:hypothetical protein